MNYIKSQDLTPHPPTLIKDPYPFPLPRDSRGYVNNIDLTPKHFQSKMKDPYPSFTRR